MARNPRSPRAVVPARANGRSRGRPEFEPTPEQRQQVETLAAYGIPQDDICRLVPNPHTGEPIDKKTLHKHFRNELDTGMTKANAKVAESLFKQATGDGKGAVTAAIFWMKARAGWKEGMDINHGVQDSLAEVMKAVDGQSRGLPNGG